MATVDAVADLADLDKSDQLDVLRRRIATVPGRRDHAPAELPAINAPEHIGLVDDCDPELPTAAVRGKTLRTMPVPPPLAALLPRRALARGTTISVTGAGSMLIALIAEVSAAGHHVALIGQPRLSLLAVHEHGGNLAKVHLVNPGATDPLDAAFSASMGSIWSSAPSTVATYHRPEHVPCWPETELLSGLSGGQSTLRSRCEFAISVSALWRAQAESGSRGLSQG